MSGIWERRLRHLLPWLAVLAALALLVQHMAVSPLPPTGRDGTWETLSGCTLTEDRRNDGDSFSVMHGGRRHVFRLYFADCPEKELTSVNGERLKDQARDFGGISVEETKAGGQAAAEFTLALLRAAPFTVQTRWEQVYESQRYYAIVTPGGSGKDLAFLLAQKGLARIHTTGTALPDGTSLSAAESILTKEAAKAKKKREGIWRAR